MEGKLLLFAYIIQSYIFTTILKGGLILEAVEYKEVSEKEKQRQMNFAKLQEILLTNPQKTKSKTFTQYTKELIKRYIRNPYANIQNIRNVSMFLERNSMIYKKMIDYYSKMPLFDYNITYRIDKLGSLKTSVQKEYLNILRNLQEIPMRKEFQKVIATAIRDGAYYGFVYDGEGDGFLLQSLDPSYCKIVGQSFTGEYIVAFDATFFEKGDNKEYLYGTAEDTEGIWDDVFVDGYEQYKNQGNEFRWFELPIERSMCIISGNDPDMPLPYFLPVFVSLLDLLDLEQILMSKTELENYVLLVSKIPLISSSNSPDDFAVSIPIVQAMQDLIDAAVPSLVGTAYSPCELDVVHFDNKNNGEDTNKLAESMHNLFSNLGMSELVVSGGSSTNSIGLKHSIQNDESVAFTFLDALQNWVNSYIRLNYSDNFIFYFHRTTYFSQLEYTDKLKDAATLGLPVAIDYATALGYTPYETMCNTYLEEMLGVKDGLWKPLANSYTQTGDESSAGAPTKKDDDLSSEGAKTRDGDKNAGTKAQK